MLELTRHDKEFWRRWDRARRSGLIAGAQVLVNALKRELAGGYTSGAFVTGALLNDIKKGTPYKVEGDELAIDVGTRLLYPVFWELGHYNAFTRRYERVQVWEPTAQRELPAMVEAFSRVFHRFMEQS